jgi:hypothetical protein
LLALTSADYTDWGFADQSLDEVVPDCSKPYTP